MENFVLENPTKILFGRETIPAIGKETRAFGTRVLLVYGKGSARQSGLLDQVIDALNQAGMELIIEHGGVRPNPLVSHVRQGIELARQHKVQVILALGGGSVIDSAKAIAAGAPVKHDVWKFFLGKKGVTDPLPLTVVLTLAASGSEMNGGMVLSDEKSGLKLGIGNKKLCPKVSILDPRLTFSVPRDQTVFGAVDAFCHLLEFYLTARGPSPVQDRFMEGVMINIRESLDRIIDTPDNYDARADMMWCATMALNGWAVAGLGRVDFPIHMIEHSLSGLFDVAHGAGLAVLMPAWLTWQARKEPAKIARLGARVFGLTTEHQAEAANRTIEGVKEWFARIEAPLCLADLGITAADIPALAVHSLTQAKIWRLREYDAATIEQILSEAL